MTPMETQGLLACSTSSTSARTTFFGVLDRGGKWNLAHRFRKVPWHSTQHREPRSGDAHCSGKMPTRGRHRIQFAGRPTESGDENAETRPARTRFRARRCSFRRRMVPPTGHTAKLTSRSIANVLEAAIPRLLKHPTPHFSRSSASSDSQLR